MSENNIQNDISNSDSGKNKLIAEIITFVLLIGVVIFFATQCSKNNTNSSSTSGTIAHTTTVSNNPVVVQDENGNQTAVINSNIPFRDVDFSSSIDEIKEKEAKSDETLDNPSESNSSDGYTYLTYSLNKDASPSLFGATANTTDSTALLVYVFKDGNLIEVRWQYGTLPSSSYDSIVSNISSQYGSSTYSRSYSNGSKESWWKTDDITLVVMYQSSGISIYYRTNS